jgi:hypothetical protein
MYTAIVSKTMKTLPTPIDFKDSFIILLSLRSIHASSLAPDQSDRHSDAHEQSRDRSHAVI